MKHGAAVTTTMPDKFQAILKPILRFSTIFGAFPHKNTGSMKYDFSWGYFMYCVFVATLVCGGGVAYVFMFGFGVDHVTIVLELIMFLFNFANWILVIVQGYRKRLAYSDIISKLHEIHTLIGKTSYCRTYAVIVFFMCAFNCIPSVLYSLGNKFDNLGIIVLIFYTVFITIPVIVAGQYAVLMNIIGDQMSSLTNQLESSKFNLEVHQLVDIHHALSILAVEINKTFNIFLLQSLTLPFIITVINVFITIVYIVKPDKTDNDLKLLTAMVDILINTGIIFLIVRAASTAKEKAKEFHAQLFNRIFTSKNLRKDDSLKMYASIKYNIDQTACGFFTLDYPLLTSMIAGAVTYVILLVQFTLLR